MKDRLHVHFIQQEENVAPGEYLEWAVRNGCRVTCTRCWLNEKMPEDTALPDLLVVLGGPQSPATTTKECPHYDAPSEMEFIIKCHEAGRAVVGSCLGAQLIGEALGAPYEHSPEREIGSTPVTLTKEGRQDPFFKDFPDTFLSGEWHNDMPGLTDDAVILAKSEGCPRQIVRYARHIYGLQCHMEFNADIVESLIEESGESLKNAKGHRFIQTKEELRSSDYTGMNRLLSLFLDALMDDYVNGYVNGDGSL